MYGVVSHEDIIQVIKNRKGLEAYITRRRNQVLTRYQELMAGTEDDWMLWAISARSRPMKDMLVQESRNHRDPLDIIGQSNREKAEWLESCQEELDSIKEQEVRMERIWMCFNMSSPESYMLLDAMYVQGEKWANLVKEMGISKSTLKSYRQKALDEVVVLYQSGLTRKQLMERREALAWKEAKKVMVVQMERETFDMVLESLKIRKDDCCREGKAELSSRYAEAIRHLSNQEHLCNIGRKAVKGRWNQEW